MLPTQKTPPKPNLHDLTVLVHGPHKYGKSTWCAQAEGALFLATEPGLNHLEVYQQPISTWDELLVAAGEIAEGKHAFRTVSDLEYGKGYALVNGEFHRVLNKLALLPYGLFLVSHSQEKEIETRTGKYTKIVPTLPDKARKLVLGLVDVILFCDLEPTAGPDGKPAYRRVLRTKPSIAYEAGDRTGRLPEVLDLDFAAFAAAFVQGAVRGATAGTSAPASSKEASPGALTMPASSTAAPASSSDSAPATSAGLVPDAAAAVAASSAPLTSGPASPASSPMTSSPTGASSTTSGPRATANPRSAGAARSPAPAKPRTGPAATAPPPASSPRAASTTTTPSSAAAAQPRATSTESR